MQAMIKSVINTNFIFNSVSFHIECIYSLPKVSDLWEQQNVIAARSDVLNIPVNPDRVHARYIRSSWIITTKIKITEIHGYSYS